MIFSELVEVLKQKGFEFSVLNGEKNPLLSDVYLDSRKVSPGSVFGCIKGESHDGHEFIPSVEHAGAVALVCEHPVETSLPCIVTESVRPLMGHIAACVYGNPAEKLFMVGITGTNGKSTTAYIVRSIMEAAGNKTGLLGTIIEYDGLKEKDAERTTSENCEVQRLLSRMVINGCTACVMETSSHGLQLGRLIGCAFDAVIFTNLNPEHLDFHGDMESYYQAKRLLFTHYIKKDAIMAINIDDCYGQRLLGEFSEAARGFALSLKDVFLSVKNVRLDMQGTSFTIKTLGFPELNIKSPLVGGFNVSNVLAAVAALRGKIPDEAVVQGIADVPQVPGRLEKYMMPNGTCCIIDFAHTPEALKNVLSSVRSFCSGKLISVFGHGGGRYPSNRPELGKAAGMLADMVIVTMDNPRNEDPELIAESIAQGIESCGQKAKYRIILDRKEAVFTALSIAGAGDVIVVSGKGPEKYLLIRDQKIPYSDAETVAEWRKISA